MLELEVSCQLMFVKELYRYKLRKISCTQNLRKNIAENYEAAFCISISVLSARILQSQHAREFHVIRDHLVHA